ncbi:hypothetical protein FQA39_LY13655 [Lamprigera yunnana]|nr:hypothetical protein FQA39_LY13655 [Lamprigera yunnana]
MFLLRVTFLVAFRIYISHVNCEVEFGCRQSPINIDTFRVVHDLATSLKWTHGYALTPLKMSLNNTGYSISLTAKHAFPLEISSGVLNVPYKFEQLHFHWGEHNDIGSEHKINGYSYPLEMHVVHSQRARNDTDELVVVAYFFKVTSTYNNELQNLLDALLVSAKEKYTNVVVKPFALARILPADFSYFTYKGSLTTPPYSESVTWIISTTEIAISKSQLDVFREAAKLKPHNGLRQSPININKEKTIPLYIRNLNWGSGYVKTPQGVNVTNVGHSFNFEVDSLYPLSLVSPLIPRTYSFSQLHFHWGDGLLGDLGSEHLINNKSYPMEMHLVHTQTSDPLYPTYLVVGYFFKVSRKRNPGLDEIVASIIKSAEKPYQPLPVQPFKLSKLIDVYPFPYYTYDGSLTTPPYTESVKWIVAAEPLAISKYQLETFQKAADIYSPLRNNYRCVQKLRGRKVYRKV